MTLIAQILGALAAVIGIPLNAYVAWRMWQLYRVKPYLLVLRERWLTAASVTLLVIVFSALFLNSEILPPPLATPEARVIARVVLLLFAVVPALYWLTIYRDRDVPTPPSPIDANTAALDANTAAIAAAVQTPTDVHVVQHDDDPAVRVKPESESGA